MQENKSGCIFSEHSVQNTWNIWLLGGEAINDNIDIIVGECSLWPNQSDALLP